MRVYSIFDRKLREYGQLVLAKNDEVIRRMALDSVRGSGGDIEQHPEDYDLYHVGDFDRDTGRLDVSDPRLVVTLQELLAAVAPKGPIVPVQS